VLARILLIALIAVVTVGCGKDSATSDLRPSASLEGPFAKVAACMKEAGGRVVTDPEQVRQLLRDLANGDRNEPWGAGNDALTVRELVPVSGTNDEESYRVLLVQPPDEPYTPEYVAERDPPNGFLVSLDPDASSSAAEVKECINTR
jgi:hypothetical protein